MLISLCNNRNSPIKSNHYKIIAVLITILVNVLVVIFSILTTITNPSDMTVYEERYSRMTGNFFDMNNYEYYCPYCETNVKENSKHCGSC